MPNKATPKPFQIDWKKTSNLINSLRKEQNVSIYELACKTGYTTSHISKICSGAQRPSIEAFFTIVQCLGYLIVTIHKNESGWFRQKL